MTLDSIKETIVPLNQKAMEISKKRWDSIAKPLHSLGWLEDELIKIAGITGDADIDISKKGILVYCADNGVVAQGVTQTTQDVTAIVTENLTKAETCVCQMAKYAGADIIPVDVGVAKEVHGPGLVIKKIASGTKDFSQEPAMTREEAIASIKVGIDMVAECEKQGYGLLGTGEMGIGNTTTSSAIAAVLLNKKAAEVTGRGAGLTSEGLAKKISVIDQAIEKWKPNAQDAIDVLSKVGGFDIGALMGTFIGGAVYHIPVMVDGFISSVSALLALRFCPELKPYIMVSHATKEPAGLMILEALGAEPVLHANMCLGEGTGTAAVMPILDMAATVYHNMSTFQDVKIEAYQPLK